MAGVKIFSIKGAFQNLLLGLKDERECALDASVDETKYYSTNEVLGIFSFLSDFITFLDAEVSNVSDEGWVSEAYFSLVI